MLICEQIKLDARKNIRPSMQVAWSQGLEIYLLLGINFWT